MSDDLAMGALEGAIEERGLAALAAGCNIALYCAPDLQATARLLAALPPLADDIGEKLRSLQVAARGGTPCFPVADPPEVARLLA